MTVTTATIAYALKRLYPQSRIDNLVYQEGWAPELEEMDEEENPPERGVKRRLN